MMITPHQLGEQKKKQTNTLHRTVVVMEDDLQLVGLWRAGSCTKLHVSAPWIPWPSLHKAQVRIGCERAVRGI